MAPHQNSTTQLVMTLDALCGRIDRPGGYALLPEGGLCDTTVYYRSLAPCGFDAIE